MEPLSVGVHSVANLGGFRANQAIAVFGCGPVGLLCMAVAKALGASRIIAVDIAPQRLEFAKKYAATEAYPPPKPLEGESRVDYSRRNAQQMKQDLNIQDRGSRAVDLVIDASGAEVSIQTALHIVKAAGTFVQACQNKMDGNQLHTNALQVGMGAPNVTINLGLLMIKEVTYKGSFRYGASVSPFSRRCASLSNLQPGDYPLAISLAASGRVDLKPLVTHR